MANEELMKRLTNPDFREILKNNLQNLSSGQGSSELINTKQNMAMELELAGTNVEALGEAERIKTAKAVEESAQKRGVLTGGYPSQKLYEEDESIRLQEIAQFAKVQEDILGRYGGYQAQKEGIALQTESAERITGMQTSSQERINQAQLEAQREIAEKGFLSAEKIAEISGKYQVQASEVSGKGAAEVRSNTDLLLQENEFFFRTDEGVKDWVAAQKLDKQSLDQAQTRFLLDYRERMREFDWTSQQQNKEFEAELTRAYYEFDKQYGLEVDKNEWMKDMAYRSFFESVREFNMTDAKDRAQFNQGLAWTKEAFNLTQEQERALHTEALDAQWDQAVLMTEADLAKHFSSLQESIREFNVGLSEQHWYAAETLKLNKAQLDQQGLANESNFMIALLESPAIGSFTDVELENVGQKIYNLLMNPEQSESILPSGYNYDGDAFTYQGIPVTNYADFINKFLGGRVDKKNPNGTNIKTTNKTNVDVKGKTMEEKYGPGGIYS